MHASVVRERVLPPACSHPLGCALSAAGAALATLEPPRPTPAGQPHWHTLQHKLKQLAGPLPTPIAGSIAAATEQAWERLWHDYPEIGGTYEPIATLLHGDTPELQHFRQLALEELLLSSQPNLGRLLDCYRRHVRHSAAVADSPLPRWLEVEPVLLLFLRVLLPQALYQHAELRPLLLDEEERDLLDQVRSRAAGQQPASTMHTETLLAELEHLPTLDQHITASEGSTIAQVQQTIVLHQQRDAATAMPDLAALYRRYQGFLIENFGLLDFRGILHLQNAVRLRLEDVYVPLAGQRTHASSATRLPGPGHLQRVARSRSVMSCDHLNAHAVIPLHDLVRDLPCLVVLGDPGAGKSTLVRSLLLALAQGQGQQQFGIEGVWLPIFFPIAAFAEARSAAGQHDLAPLDYLSIYYQGLSQPNYSILFRRALLAGRALVLFDGIDEVRGDRLAMVRCLEAFVREWDAPGNRFITTSRIAGYDDAPLDENLFACITVQPLTDAGIRSFIARWSNAYERAGAHDLPTDPQVAELELQRRTEAHTSDLSAAVFTDPHVTALARSPLLLTILALIHHEGARLPDRRVDLYRLCVEALAETWNRARSLSGREIDVYLGSEKLDERFVVNLLGPAALWMREESPGGLVERSDLEQQIAATLVQTDGLPHGRARRLAQSFVDLMRRETGLLQERGYQRYGFLHLTFEEYLAARALLESVTVHDPDALVHARCTDPGWREVLRLMVAAAPQREAQRLLLHLLAAPTSSETYGRPVVLAGECLLDIGRNSATQRAWSAVEEHLVTLMSNPAPTFANRLAAGEVLGKLDDPRLLDVQSGNAPACPYWCPIEAGAFWYSSDHTRRRLQQARLPRCYAIARFPVTNAEYARFIAAGGYHTRRWWSAVGWAFLQPGGHPSPLDDPAQFITHPSHWEHPSFSEPNQPVVGVSWYEASAYCAWLTHQGHTIGWLPATATIRLPTSLEWERAARHTDQRHYPWGDTEPDSDYANSAESDMHCPTPVGCYPLGAAACGALDMAGNVWEWTATLTDECEQVAPRNDFTLTEKPAIRGGAFNWSRDYLHCGAAYWFSPGHRQNLVGFRIVRSDEHDR